MGYQAEYSFRCLPLLLSLCGLFVFCMGQYTFFVILRGRLGKLVEEILAILAILVQVPPALVGAIRR